MIGIIESQKLFFELERKKFSTLNWIERYPELD